MQKKSLFSMLMALMLMLSLVLSFTACEEDDDDSPSGGKTDSTIVEDGGTITGTYTDGAVIEVPADATVNLVGKVIFEDGTKLVVNEGATILADVSDLSVLIISQGAQIEAIGTADKPITFTRKDTSDTWGGIVINGKAQTNKGLVDNGEADSGTYGANDDANNADNSGTLKYVRVYFAGWNFTADDQLNGICLQGVGSGTTVDYIHTHRGADDGIEMFGGTVNISHIVSSGNEDDQIDCTDGWNGTIEYAVAISLNEKGNDKAIEHDNNSKDNLATPVTTVNYKYATVITGATEIEDDGVTIKGVGGARIREGATVNFENSYFFALSTADSSKLVDVRDATSKSNLKDCTFQGVAAGDDGQSTKDGATITTEGTIATDGSSLVETNFSSYLNLKNAGPAALVTSGNGAITDSLNNWASWVEFPTE